MNGLVVISTANAVKVDMKDYYPVALNISNGIWRKENISFQKMANYIECNIEGEKTWYVSFNGYIDEEQKIKSLKVDTVNTVDITDNDILYTELSKMLE